MQLARPDRIEELRVQKVGDCTRCKLHCTRKNIVFGEGSAYADLVFIGEAPGAWEDEKGRPFVGRAGQLLNNIIKALDLNREEAYITNIVKCRPPGNRDPHPDEIEQCRDFLNEQLLIIEPKIIVTLGRYATQTLLNTTEGIGKLRGEWQKYNVLTWKDVAVMPTYHPAYLLRNPAAKAEVREDMWKVKMRLSGDS
jgi:DNA polymerase